MGIINFFKKIFNKEKEEIHNSLPIYHNKENNDIEILNSLKIIDKGALSLEKIETESDALNNYLNGLITDINSYEEKNNDKTANSISTKIKHVIIHGLELKNLIAIVEDQYYSTFINELKKIKKNISPLINRLENEKSSLVDLESEIAKLVVYDYKLNSEKNVNYVAEIKEEIKKRELKNDIENLMKKISLIITKVIKSKIERENVIEEAKNML